MKKFEKIIDSLKHKSPLTYLYENGYTPEMIKNEIFSSFEPYFIDRKSLEKFAINYMVSDWINYLQICVIYPNIENDIKLVLDRYNEAKSKKPNETIKLMSEMMQFHLETGNKFWSFINLEVSKSELELDEFVQTSMKDISDVIECLSKNFYIEQVGINRILRDKAINLSKLVESKLGNLIEELIVHSTYSKLFKTQPDNLKLSDWRNIAAHHKYSIQKEIIQCEYGVAENKKTLSIDREELFDRLHQCVRTMQVLNMAHKFFAYDNMDEISKVINPTDKDARIEMSFLTFSSALMSQGFEVININYETGDTATLELKDLTQDDPEKRGIHSSQFLVNLWLVTNKAELIVKYHKENGELFMISKCDGNTCDLISSKEKNFSYLAENVVFETLNGG